jgi:methyl-accepting chemotaxis protein
MDKVTQQNAANAEESASASEELSAQAESMAKIIDQLIGLVNGSSAHQAARTTTANARKTGGNKGATLGHLDNAFHSIASGSGVKERTIKMNKPTPSQQLPLDDSEFNSFNG